VNDVRYCTTADGISIAYSVQGHGPPLIALPAFFESFSVIHYMPAEDEFWKTVAQRRTLIRLDWRGTGLSQREIADFTLQDSCNDIGAVADALGLRAFALWASTAAGPIALGYAATQPKRVSRLVVYGSYRRPIEAISGEAMAAYATLWRTNPDIAAQTLADLTGREIYPAEAVQMARMYRESVDGETAARIFEASLRPDWDATPYLPNIKALTLVIHRRGDSLFPFASGQAISAGIKNARFVPLEGAVHYHALADSAAVLDAMLSFLAEDERKPRRSKAAPSASGVTTVLFTDIVGHTEMMQRLGDARGRDVLREHERITRDTLKQHGGTEVKTMGDGFMASFGSVTSAMECAIALQQAFATHTASMPEPLHVRVGLNAGEPIEEDGDLFGATVILASRIAAKAGPGEILVPDTVRGLLSGKGFMFGDRGEFVPKGFDDGVRLWDVRWQE
jgi:class 3 adenylate cyclase